MYPNDEDHAKLRSYLKTQYHGKIKAEPIFVDVLTEMQALSYLYERKLIRVGFFIYYYYKIMALKMINYSY